MSLEAAEDILAREGAAGLSVRRIAQAIGYTHGTLYLLFRNLDGLLLELNGRTLDDLAAALQAAAAAAPPGTARVQAVAQAYLAFARRHAARFRLVFQHRLPPGQAAPQWLEDRIAQGYELLESALARAANDTDARLGPALWSAIHGATVLSLDGKLVDRSGAALDPAPVLTRAVEAFCAER